MSIESFFSGIVHKVVVGAEDAEKKIVLELGSFKQYVEAHPTLEKDLKLLFGKALSIVEAGIPALKTAITTAATAPGATLASVWQVAHTGLFSLLGETSASISSDVSNPANAIAILSTIGTALSQAIDTHVSSVAPAAGAAPAASAGTSVAAQ
ncbi:MAG TPA: hypothetical protein VEZ90_09180 [Blastocatellia bacterium]|nr:hypothetical protein [Blastocatellia bacterium]